VKRPLRPLSPTPSAFTQETWGKWRIRQFLIFVDGSGAYEVAAEDCEGLPEEAAL
jgi:hypothetical protein